jgi:DNA polymerase III subunit delta'
VTIHGHDSQIAEFVTAMTGERLHHAWLLAGPRGVGKGRFADWAAHRLLDADTPQSQGAHLLSAGSHPDFRRLERLTNEKTGNLARNISVDQVRGLRTLFATATSLGNRRVIVIDSIDEMERGAANALLKSLEEPPANTIFLLVSHAPGRLLPTIRSRCRTLVFKPLDDAAMRAVLDAELPEIDPTRRDALIVGANGSPAMALAYADLDMAAINVDLAELAATGDPTNAIRGRLAQSLALKPAFPRYEAFLARAPAFIAERARESQGHVLDAALTAWSKARALSQIAIPQSLIAETVVFELAGMVASLAPTDARAKG